MASSPAERDEYSEYFCGSGAIPCRVLYRTEQLVFVQFRTVDWPGYKDYSNYARVALFPEHLRPADPRSPSVVGFAQAIAREVAAQQQHVSNCRHQANGPERVEHRVTHPEKPTEKLTAARGNGVKPPPKSASARQLRVRTSGKDGHSLKPARSISGLTIADFLYDR
jgi:hypothetical protein